MKNNGFEDKRLLEALDYLDDGIISEMLAEVRVDESGKKARGAHLRRVLALAACVVLLGAVMPVVSYVINNYPGAGGPSASSDSTTLSEDPTEVVTDDTEAETEVRHEHDGSEGLVYQLNDDADGYTLVSVGSCDVKEVRVASTYDGLPVTAIGELAFLDAPKCEVILIPDTVSSVGARAFKNCAKLKTVVFPDSLTKIGSYAFENCVSLNSVFLPWNLEVLEEGLFAGCSSLRGVEIRDALKSIEGNAFVGCTSLVDLIFTGTKREWNNISKVEGWSEGSGIYKIDANSGSFLLTVTVGSEGLVYKHDSKNTYVEYSSSLTSVGTCTDKNIVIASSYNGDDVWIIGKEAFLNCTFVESVTLPRFLFDIGERAFAGCTNLKDVYYEGTVSEWKEIIQSEDWNKGCPFTVIHCIDGDVEP